MTILESLNVWQDMLTDFENGHRVASAVVIGSGGPTPKQPTSMRLTDFLTGVLGVFDGHSIFKPQGDLPPPVEGVPAPPLSIEVAAVVPTRLATNTLFGHDRSPETGGWRCKLNLFLPAILPPPVQKKQYALKQGRKATKHP